MHFIQSNQHPEYTFTGEMLLKPGAGAWVTTTQSVNVSLLDSEILFLKIGKTRLCSVLLLQYTQCLFAKLHFFLRRTSSIWMNACSYVINYLFRSCRFLEDLLFLSCITHWYALVYTWRDRVATCPNGMQQSGNDGFLFSDHFLIREIMLFRNWHRCMAVEYTAQQIEDKK